MKFTLSESAKEHLKSAGITFFAGFAMAVVPLFDTFSVQGLEISTYVALVLTGFRAGCKLLLQAFLTWYGSRK